MATKKKARKKKRKGHYHTGTYISPKCPTPIEYRSGWEKTVCEYLDNDPKVIKYVYEGLIITYTSNLKSKKVRKYIPDFVVYYADGTVKMVEVKRQSMVLNARVQKKAAAAKIWCANQNPPMIYEFWTDAMILPLQKAAKLREKVLAAKQKK